MREFLESRRPLVMAVAGLVVVAVVVAIIVNSGGDAVPLDLATSEPVAIYACPGVGMIGHVTLDDAPAAVGVSGDGAWVAIETADGVAYLSRSAVSGTIDLSGLPTRDCDAGAQAQAATIPTTVATTTVDGTGNPGTTNPGNVSSGSSASTTTTSTTVVNGGTKPPSGPTTTTTTIVDPNDTAPPVISNASASPSVITEQDTATIACPANTLRELTLAATITDDRALSTVTVSWTLPGGSQTVVDMTRDGDRWSAMMGPFTAGTLPAVDNVVDVLFRAGDATGKVVTLPIQVTVHGIESCRP